MDAMTAEQVQDIITSMKAIAGGIWFLGSAIFWYAFMQILFGKK